MSNWNMYEIEDVVWDAFDACSDHIVPHPGVDSVIEVRAQHDSNKRQRHDSINSSDEISDKDEPGESNIFQENEELVFNSSLEGYQSNVGHILREIFSSDADIVKEDVNMEMKNRDILDFEWLGFDDFGDVDCIFRHGYPTFAQGSGGPANELSWFSSSSYTIDDTEDTLKSSLQPSCSEMNVLKTYSNNHEASMTGWPEKVATINEDGESCHDYDSYGQWFDADTQYDLVSKKLPTDFRIGGSSLSSTINSTNLICMDTYDVSSIVNSERSMPMVSDTEGIKLDQNSGYISGYYHVSDQSACYNSKLDNPLEISTPESYAVGMVGDSNNFLEMHSSNYLSLNSSNLEVMHDGPSQVLQPKPGKQPSETKPLDSNELLDQSLGKKGRLVPKITNNVEKLLPTIMKPILQGKDAQQSANSMSPIGNSTEWKASGIISSISDAAQSELKDSLTGRKNELGIGEATITSSTLEANRSSMQGSSCTTSSGSILSGSSSLHKLQEVLTQLDLKTKLCIRDGLYRLAINAAQRHSPDVLRYGCKGEMITSNIIVANDSNRYPKLVYEETGTNPIDRSIAHLLFYKASGHCVGPADDAMSA